MVEKTITLENIPLAEFLGIENENIEVLATAFPKSKIISRGNEIRIQGASAEIKKINEILNGLVDHYHKYGKISKNHVSSFINSDSDVFGEEESDVLVFGTRGSKIAPKSQNQQKLVLSSRKNDLVFAIGPAGTGKTYISVAMAVKALKDRSVKKIIITRPAVEAGENLGFLPGDLKEKIDPYLRPIYDALNDMVPSEKLRFYMETGVIEIAPLAYMRGRTLNNAFILLDEAQNTTPMQIKMFMTRMGPNSKVIITGDMSQIDLPTKQKSGLRESIRILKDVKGIGFVTLDGKDVMRHALVKNIIDAYDKASENE
ncbi:PhoH family protein [Reichenbachiella agariperforans]|uniref:PhoH-like protein n=1 Tax=Reichenbachiella agariperforans TaxID=156994 RepID=A0A1M6U9P1_REIAG|nr:PhoH family protein [Reichenbachiella agariperforans]MBU2912541.1 PhoH family protein [Reichenbachiella agariperforans]SHK65972.1 phosphate starvation-inducible protein PhoH [Reichenbachiella agariperforans]